MEATGVACPIEWILTTVSVLRTRAEFAEIRDAWTNLRAERPGGSPCLDWHWFDRFWEAMVPARAEAAVITVWSDRRLLGAAPVVVTPPRPRLIGLSAITGMENAHTAAYEWLLTADAHAAERAAGEIATALVAMTGRRGIVSWRNAPEKHPATHMARAALETKGWRVMWRPGRPHRVIHFPQGTDAFVASLSANMRARLRKSGRRLEQAGAVRFREVSGAADLHERLAAAWDLESRGWKGRAGTSVNQDEQVRRFYDSLALSLASERRFALFELTCADRVVAFLYGLAETNRLYGLKFGYDADFARASPGHVIILRVMEWAAVHGISSLDLGGDSEFKAHWNGELEEMGSVHGLPGGVRGAAAVVGLAWPAAARRFRARSHGQD